jgi:hypothetical protein
MIQTFQLRIKTGGMASVADNFPFSGRVGEIEVVPFEKGKPFHFKISSNGFLLGEEQFKEPINGWPRVNPSLEVDLCFCEFQALDISSIENVKQIIFHLMSRRFDCPPW